MNFCYNFQKQKVQEMHSLFVILVVVCFSLVLGPIWCPNVHRSDNRRIRKASHEKMHKLYLQHGGKDDSRFSYQWLQNISKKYCKESLSEKLCDGNIIMRLLSFFRAIIRISW